MACYICGDPSVLKCKECGKSVCGRHYNYDDGLCTVCHNAKFAKPDAINPEDMKPATAVETKPAFAPETKPMQPKAKKGKK